MRNPARIGYTLQCIANVWREHPDMRLGQLLCVAANYAAPPKVGVLFYMEDEPLIDGLQAFGRTQPPPATASSTGSAITDAGSTQACSEESGPPPSPPRRSE